MSPNNYLTSNLKKKTAIINGSIGLLLAIGSPTVIAQEVQAALLNKNQNTQQNEDVETIQVEGVRGSLESALLSKREATTIVDAISSADIDALPALDFGEALQAIPGIQLNRDGEGRTSEISLRGLPGGYVKTTAFGQSFATPSRSFDAVGGSNPFSAFEAGVFDGVTVIKTPSADMQAGGMAGIVDKKLQQALSKQDGKYNISLGGRYEDLTGNWDKTIKLSAAKHLIENELAVAFKFSGSEQTFRRDTMNFTNYIALYDQPDNPGASQYFNSNTISAYRTKWGIPDNAEVRAINGGRNVTEYSDGDRVSATGNIEWKPTQSLKLGAHFLYTERDLDDGTKEDSQFTSGQHPTRPQNSHKDSLLEPDMDTQPFLYDTNLSGNPVYGVSKTHFENGSWQTTNRKTTFLETSKGIMLYGDYRKDDWILDGVISYSESENQFMNIGVDFRHTQHQNATFFFTPGGATQRVSVDSVPTGIDGTINTGGGKLSDIEVSATGWDTYEYDVNWSIPSTSSATITSVDDANQGRRIQLALDGRVDNPTRKMRSVEFNAERLLEFSLGDAFSLGSIKFGARSGTEELKNRDQKIGAPGINVDNINNNFLNDNIISSQDTAFFGGNIPGTFGQGEGWRTFDTAYAYAQLQDGLLDLTDKLTFADPSGFYDRLNPNTGLPNFFANNFSVDQSITAAYLMGDFSGELGSVYYRGNIGFRHERTTNDFLGFKAITDNQTKTSTIEEVTLQTEYSNTLPSMNISFEISDDFMIRAAYYDSLVRPNLRVQTPTFLADENNTRVQITLPKAEVTPYDANNLDLSFEWYNREGSAISLGIFHKKINGIFKSETICPENGAIPEVNEVTGEIVRTINDSSVSCTQAEPFIGDDGEERTRNVVVKQLLNLDNTIKLNGVEIAVQQKLDFLPYPWNGFGGVFNYTYIDQSGDEGSDKLYQVSPESYNLIGYWEDKNFSIRLAYNWRDDYKIQGNSSFLGEIDRTKRANGRLDLATSYKIAPGLKVFLKGYNITDEIGYEHYGYNEQAVTRLDYTGRIYELSLNYSF